MATFGKHYARHIHDFGFCPVEASSEGYQGAPLMRRPSLHMLLADAECGGCGELPGGCTCGVER